jgi:hypothetical protein
MQEISKTPKAQDAKAASYERYLEIHKNNYQQAKARRREEVRNFTLFEIDIVFWKGLDDALTARRELIAAGFEFEIKAAIDPYSKAVFTQVRRACPHAGADEDMLWEQVEEIVKPFDGEVDNGGLVEDLTRERDLRTPQ